MQDSLFYHSCRSSDQLSKKRETQNLILKSWAGSKIIIKDTCTWQCPKNTISINKFEKIGFVLGVKLAYNHGKVFEQTLVYIWNNTDGKSLISVFQQFFASIDKILILWGRVSTRL